MIASIFAVTLASSVLTDDTVVAASVPVTVNVPSADSSKMFFSYKKKFIGKMFDFFFLMSEILSLAFLRCSSHHFMFLEFLDKFWP